MDVKLIAHTQLSKRFFNENLESYLKNSELKWITDGQIVSLTAIRTCYSSNKPTEILAKEGEKYFGKDASDGEGGTDADRLFRHIFRSKHTSTLEHITYTFAVEGLSRAALAQLTRHRVGFSFSVQSQRYVRLGSEDKTGGFDYVVPQSCKTSKEVEIDFNDGDPPMSSSVNEFYKNAMRASQLAYDSLRAAGVPPEDARMVLPQAAVTNLVMTVNLRALLDFYSKRRKGSGAQWEIAELAERLREEVVAVEPWIDQFFEEGGA